MCVRVCVAFDGRIAADVERNGSVEAEVDVR